MRTVRRTGQGMTEYIIIVALVAIASIAVVTIFGDQLREIYAAVTDNVAGKPRDPKPVDDPSKEVRHSLKDL